MITIKHMLVNFLERIEFLHMVDDWSNYVHKYPLSLISLINYRECTIWPHHGSMIQYGRKCGNSRSSNSNFITTLQKWLNIDQVRTDNHLLFIVNNWVVHNKVNWILWPCESLKMHTSINYMYIDLHIMFLYRTVLFHTRCIAPITLFKI